MYQCQPKCRVDFLEYYDSSKNHIYHVTTLKVKIGRTTWNYGICLHNWQIKSTILEISCLSWVQGIIFSYFGTYQSICIWFILHVYQLYELRSLWKTNPTWIQLIRSKVLSINADIKFYRRKCKKSYP